MLDQYFVKGKINGGTMIFIVCYYSTLNMSRNLYFGYYTTYCGLLFGYVNRETGRSGQPE
jgi:hypothetical protein